jgi:predicted DNA-binding transcriptional regulator AlpA
MKDGFYSASEAQEKLGLSKAMFHRKVKQGLIPKVTPTGMKQGVYPKRDIDALTLSMNRGALESDEPLFSRSSPADLAEEMELGVLYYGRDFIAPLADRLAMQQRSEFTFWSLKHHGHVVGYTSLMRLPDELLADLLSGLKIERDIGVRDVLPFERLQPFTAYTDVFVVDPHIPSAQQHIYVDALIAGLVDVLFDLRTNGYLVERWTAVTVSPVSDAVAEQLRFRWLPGSIAPGRKPCECVLDEEHLRHLWSLSSKRDLPFPSRLVADRTAS